MPCQVASKVIETSLNSAVTQVKRLLNGIFKTHLNYWFHPDSPQLCRSEATKSRITNDLESGEPELQKAKK